MSAQGTGGHRARAHDRGAQAERAGIWTVEAGIFPENGASAALHRRAGFRVVGTRERLGQMGGVWRDVMWLERRSPAIG